MSEKLLGNLEKGLLFIVSGPAGTGKTSLVNRLLQEFSCVIASISFTTRKMRPGEVSGVNYHFVSREEFEHKVARGDFLEHVSLYGDYYGTAYATVQEKLDAGKHVVLVIDTQGALLLKGKTQGVFIFIKPPSLDTLRQRLLHRKTESVEVIEERLSYAKGEIDAMSHYDYCIVNDDFEIAYQVLRSIFIAEEHRCIRHLSK